ncbi:hypothetical protein [Komagataeibacter oboediens]|uniref:hypothetical protein n=1 Tax=Komagataeibacter oboediens TaxID=65958 RepID=UPI001902D23C|nr:hypothetical protein [Komagataeibacter oboediens]GCE80865.1 hypothetical protein MSKU3_2340 [Komagataeibacter oboediens]
MFAHTLTQELLRVLERPDLRVIAGERQIALDPALDLPFRVQPTGAIVLGLPAQGQQEETAFFLRHALELAPLLEIVPHRALCAAFCAARTAALFWYLDTGRSDADAPATWVPQMAQAQVPPPSALRQIWQALAPLQPDVPRHVGTDRFAALHDALRGLWPILGPTENLMATGGDARLAVDPATGLNHYGCSHRPRPWAITFASSTASSLSERGFAGAETARLSLLAGALHGRGEEAACALDTDIQADIAAHFGLVAGEGVVLAPSGTDCELYALALASLAPGGRPLSNIVLAPEETGSGVPLAAMGCHFANDTALGHGVTRGAPIAGFPIDTLVMNVPMRDAEGHVRPVADVDAETCRLTHEMRAAGRHVLLHRLDLSKTGLLAPGLPALEQACAPMDGMGDGPDVVVDACQARLDPMRVRDYLDRGWMVMVTGSKFFTGPPFCGALLLPVGVRRRLDGPRSVPVGLEDYSYRHAWPRGGAVAGLPAGHNIGLILRWCAALAEMAAFSRIPRATVHDRLRGFLSAVSARIMAEPALELLPPVRPERVPMEGAWDTLPTIMCFFVRAPDCDGEGFRPLALPDARRLYAWLNTDLSGLIPPDDPDVALACLLCHVGQPVPLAHPGLPGMVAGALRISAGARLVAGEPSHEGMDPTERLRREVRNVGRIVDKINLILRHWSRLSMAAPVQTYLPHGWQARAILPA